MWLRIIFVLILLRMAGEDIGASLSVDMKMFGLPGLIRDKHEPRHPATVNKPLMLHLDNKSVIVFKDGQQSLCT